MVVRLLKLAELIVRIRRTLHNVLLLSLEVLLQGQEGVIVKQLVEAILTLKNANETKRFLRDLMTEPEIKEFLPELKEVLDKFSELSKADIPSNVNASFQPIEVKNIFREDKIEKCLTQEEALKNAKRTTK